MEPKTLLRKTARELIVLINLAYPTLPHNGFREA
jgi:hypothetical protein